MRGMFPHVAFKFWIGVAPLLRGLPEEGDVEHIRLIGVGDGGLRRSDFSRDKVGFHGIGVDAVIELGQGAVEVPS